MDKRIFFIAMAFLAAFALTMFYLGVLEPAYMSVVAACYEGGEEAISDSGYHVSGGMDVMDEDAGNGTVAVRIFFDDLPTLKHELCHVAQLQRGYMMDCSRFSRQYLGEVECYIAQNFPNALFERIYPFEIDRII